jgi:hypothetical protein
MELDEALSQIAEIRRQVARTTVFRGYRALPVAFSGVLALVAGGAQAWWLPEAAQNPTAYLTLWIEVAVLSVLATAGEMAWRLVQSGSSLERAKTSVAVTQFVPCLAAGALLTVVLVRWAPETLWMLPGLWQVLFGLGIFASWRCLPHAVFWIAVFYLTTGLVCLAWAQGAAAFSPWAMALPFGVGQLATAGILYCTLERADEQE